MTLEELRGGGRRGSTAPDVEVTDDGSAVWSRDGVAFAELEGAARLGRVPASTPTLAAAAARTPDTVVDGRVAPSGSFRPGRRRRPRRRPCALFLAAIAEPADTATAGA